MSRSMIMDFVMA